MLNNNEAIFSQIAESQREYLSQWYLESPAVITSNIYNELHRVQQLLHKAILYFVDHCEDYEHIFPLMDNVRRVVDICRPYPYRIGTYRPDFLIDENRQIKICEIGTRFPLNGYFLSGIAEYIGWHRYRYESYMPEPMYSLFLHYLSDYWGDIDIIYVLKGNDRPCDIKYYIPFFEKSGLEIRTIYPEQITPSFKKKDKHGVVNEFNQMEIETLSDDVIRAIAGSNSLNDMRTIFLIHDKRFLAVLSDDSFLSQFLSEEEQSFLSPYLIPTYTYWQAPDIWEQARKEKDRWVIKHALLGKSEQVFTGRTCTEEEWENLFDLSIRSSMVLQPFIYQQRFQSNINDQTYNDYIVGTLLCFDNQFFGPGIFRTSSFEITNRIDDRKMPPCFTNNYSEYTNSFIL